MFEIMNCFLRVSLEYKGVPSNMAITTPVPPSNMAITMSNHIGLEPNALQCSKLHLKCNKIVINVD
jgi:hypothetical protein